MSNILYVAVALCIGSPSDWSPDKAPSINGVRVGACDYGIWYVSNGQKGYTEDECLSVLKNMHERGNVFKMCVPIDGAISGGHVEWNSP